MLLFLTVGCDCRIGDLHRSLRGNPNLELFGFDVRIGGQTLIENADLHVAQGHRYGLVGKNGVGKTSFVVAYVGLPSAFPRSLCIFI